MNRAHRCSGRTGVGWLTWWSESAKQLPPIGFDILVSKVEVCPREAGRSDELPDEQPGAATDAICIIDPAWLTEAASIIAGAPIPVEKARNPICVLQA